MSYQSENKLLIAYDRNGIELAPGSVWKRRLPIAPGVVITGRLMWPFSNQKDGRYQRTEAIPRPPDSDERMEKLRGEVWGSGARSRAAEDTES